MSFLENMDGDMQNVILNTTEHAETITYTVQGGSPKSIEAVVDRGRYDEIENGPQGLQRNREIEIWISTDATAGIETPSTDDEVTIDGKNWNVEQVMDQDGYGAHLILSRRETIEKSEDDHRMGMS